MLKKRNDIFQNGILKKLGKPFYKSFPNIVPRAGIEPARLAALDFESSASTSSAIWAYSNLTGANIDIIFITAKKNQYNFRN